MPPADGVGVAEAVRASATRWRAARSPRLVGRACGQQRGDPDAAEDAQRTTAVDEGADVVDQAAVVLVDLVAVLVDPSRIGRHVVLLSLWEQHRRSSPAHRYGSTVRGL